jgi:DMSO/TMAO reductase YedYZ molybdopterin-dependent catalytic subunit
MLMASDASKRQRIDLPRRRFLGQAAAAPLILAGAGVRADDKTDTEDATGMVIRQHQPDNLEYPFTATNAFITPNERFFVRSHFEVPKINADAWQLKIEGTVQKPLVLSLRDLNALPQREVTATLECAGNGRVFLVPRAKGLLWEGGAVGNAVWSGVPLADLLKQAGVAAQAVDVVLEGADKGAVNDDPKTPGVIQFARSIPLSRAQKPDVLLATKMNGQPLPVSHGFPVRAVVPGWYGVASIKWLQRIVVLDRPFDGYHQTMDYAIFQRKHGLPMLTPVTQLQVKAQIARPGRFETLPAGHEYRVHGAAWTGEGTISRVEISSDGGKNWSEVELLGEGKPATWRLWQYRWHTPAAERTVKLMVRATDDRGNTQPMDRDNDRRTYMINHVIPLEVEVR